MREPFPRLATKMIAHSMILLQGPQSKVVKTVTGELKLAHARDWTVQFLIKRWLHFIDFFYLNRQLGYDSGWPVGGSFFGPGIGTIWLDEVYCSGAESDINSCRHEPIGHHDCTHTEDAGVICGQFLKRF